MRRRGRSAVPFLFHCTGFRQTPAYRLGKVPRDWALAHAGWLESIEQSGWHADCMILIGQAITPNAPNGEVA